MYKHITIQGSQEPGLNLLPIDIKAIVNEMGTSQVFMPNLPLQDTLHTFVAIKSSCKQLLMGIDTYFVLPASCHQSIYDIHFKLVEETFSYAHALPGIKPHHVHARSN